MRNFIITIEGKQYEVGVEEVTNGAQVATPVVTEIKKAPTPVAAPVKAAQSAPVSGEEFKAPMPGMIKSLAKKDGDTVKKNDVILVLEAMKMDNDMVAPCDGVITYKTAVGANVDTGAVLAIIG